MDRIQSTSSSLQVHFVRPQGCPGAPYHRNPTRHTWMSDLRPRRASSAPRPAVTRRQTWFLLIGANRLSYAPYGTICQMLKARPARRRAAEIPPKSTLPNTHSGQCPSALAYSCKSCCPVSLTTSSPSVTETVDRCLRIPWHQQRCPMVKTRGAIDVRRTRFRNMDRSPKSEDLTRNPSVHAPVHSHS